MGRYVGSHFVEVEGDLLKLTAHGSFTLEDMKEFSALADEHAGGHGYLLILNNLADGKLVSPEARKYSAQQIREAKKHGPIYAASASFGASTLLRGAAALYFAMLRLLSDGDQDYCMAKTEEEARAYLDERRRYFQSKRKPSP